LTERHRDFSSKRKKTTDPVTFTIESETFTAQPSIPGAVLLDFIADADSGDGGRAAQALVDFIEKVVVEDEREAFRDVIRDPEKDIDIATLAEICEWLVGEYTARPTDSPSPSAPTRPAKNGRGSTARS